MSVIRDRIKATFYFLFLRTRNTVTIHGIHGGNLFVFANLIEALATIVSYLLQIYMWVIIIRALISWVNPDPYNPIVRFLYQVTEPVLYPIRRRLPFMGGIDLSPIIVLLAILFLQVFLVKTLNELALRLKMGGGL